MHFPPTSTSQKTLVYLFVMLITFLAACPAGATEKKIGLVLSGGGARGLAHIGVLKALEEKNVRISAIAGTSMGAVIGALYATGKTPEEIELLAGSMDWGQALNDEINREHLSFRKKQDGRDYLVNSQATIKDGIFSLPKGIVQGQNLQLLLQRLFVHVSNEGSFDDFFIPFRAVAADLVTGDAIVLSRGSLATAVRASMSIPGYYAPVEINGTMLVDGGIANNLPVDVAKSMGVDKVIVVDIATPLYKKEELNSVLPIIEQLTTLLTTNKVERQYALLKEGDLIIAPDLGKMTNTEFSSLSIAVEAGYEATTKKSELASFISTDKIARHKVDSQTPPQLIDAIDLANRSRLSDKFILAHISQAIGSPIDRKKLEEDLQALYGFDYFERLGYEITRSSKGNTLYISTVEKSWGQDLLGVHFDLFTNSDGESGYNLGLNFRKSSITGRGGESFTAIQFGEEPQISSELFLPFDLQQISFLKPYFSFGQEGFNQVYDHHIESRQNLEKLTLGIALGFEFSNLGTFALGIEEQRGNLETVIGPQIPSIHFKDVSRYFLFEYDSLDNLDFPSSGTYLRFRLDRVSPKKRQAEKFSLASSSFLKSVSTGRNSFIFKVELTRNIHEVSGRHFQQSLGGFLRLSGLHENSLTGNSSFYSNITWLRRLTRQSILPVDLPVYAGLTLEAGNVWENAADVSTDDLLMGGAIMIAIDSPLGPVYFGYGRTEDDYSGYYIKLGRVF